VARRQLGLDASRLVSQSSQFGAGFLAIACQIAQRAVGLGNRPLRLAQRVARLVARLLGVGNIAFKFVDACAQRAQVVGIGWRRASRCQAGIGAQEGEQQNKLRQRTARRAWECRCGVTAALPAVPNQGQRAFP
jgi:hypothetical protein